MRKYRDILTFHINQMTTKITALVLYFWVFTFFTNAQTTLTTYHQPHNGKTYSINILEGNNHTRSLCISLPSNDSHKQNGGIIVDIKNLDRFLNALNKAKYKYIKLNNIYTHKEINTIDQNLKIKCKVKGYFMYGKLWQFQPNLHPNFHYSIKNARDNKEYCLTLNTGKISSSENWFVNSEGYNITFTSSEEIDNFIALFSKEEINRLCKQG